MSAARDTLLVGVLLGALLAWPLVSPPIGLHGEAREGLVVQDIVHRGDWVLPLRNGELPSKPPLFHWMAALVAAVFGLSDVTLRLPSALATWVMASATVLLGTAVGERRTGWLAAGVLVGTPPVIEAATEARVDMVFAACITVAMTGFFFWYRAEECGVPRPRLALPACYLGAAAAVLAKGPAGLVLSGLIIAAFLTYERRLDLLRRMWSWPLALAVLVVDGGWYALATATGGREFLTVQLFHENVERFVGHGTFAARRRAGGYFERLEMPLALAIDYLPWSAVLVVSVWRARRGIPEDSRGAFLHIWIIAVLAFFTLAAANRSIYLLPLAPALALLAARRLAEIPIAVGGGWRLAVGVAVFAVVLGAGRQVFRILHDERTSLAPFAAEVQRRVGPGVPLYATLDLPPEVIYTLAYRLDRPIPRHRPTNDERGYVLVPATRSPRLTTAGLEVVASSGPRTQVVLMRAGGEAGDARARSGP